ncbi:hypothetical protein DPM19_00950 [Actinomadura craniellae]|uniref:Uncharacterized protein n=1 Tax=Actinomadura craniellae TaxID=2231787 RepID=A0A365HCN4_9ACTN|nr:hypothetical protein DPM19_00950 [Actinomadura craniellae]
MWIGRDAGGQVTCFVADMLVLHDTKALPPTTPSTAVFLPPTPPGTDDRRQAPFTRPSATAEFITTQITDIVDFRAELNARRR